MKRYEFERVAPEKVGIPSQVIDKLLDRFESVDYCEPHGLMIMRHGKICAEGWWSPYAAGVPHLLWSLTKTYTGTAIGIAYTEGLLDLDDRIIDYFPEYASIVTDKNIKDLKIRDALKMASGKPELRCDKSYWREHFFKIPFNNKPGTKFEYSCEDTHILMAIVQKVSGQSLHEYLKPRLFDKIGIDSDNLKWVYLPDGSEIGAGGLLATTEDSLRLMKLYLQVGVWENKRILASDYVIKATTKQINNWAHGYGFQIWMGPIKGSYFGSGALGQTAIVVPDLDIIIVFYQTGEYYNPEKMVIIAKPIEDMHKAVGDIFNILIPMVQKFELPKNYKASENLISRLERLSLGNPQSRPRPDISQKISGKRYVIKNGRFTLRNSIWEDLTKNGPYSSNNVGLDWFSFDFSQTDVCKFNFQENDSEISLNIGLDGVRRLNRYNLHNTLIDKVVLDGAWNNKNTFELNARWIEICFSIKVVFKFLEKSVDISASNIFGDYESHPLRERNAIAEILN